MQQRKKYTLQNPLMFTVVMKDPKRCIGLIERIFPGRKVKELKFVYSADEDEIQEDFIKTIVPAEAETERTYIVGVEAKAIRMDVLFENSEAWYDIEMQVFNRDNLPKRGRYYHAVKTVDSLRAGAGYDELKEGYVIFINGFDPFGYGVPVYMFEMYDKKLQLSMGDGQYTIFLNSTCKENVPAELAGFYHYLQTGEVIGDDGWLNDIAAAVEDANNRKEVWSKVTLYDEIQMMENILKAKDHELETVNQELLAKERFNRLTVLLAQHGRVEDILRASEDEVHRDKLFAEFNI